MTMKNWLIGLITLAFVESVSAGPQLTSVMLRGVTVPIFVSGETQAVATLRMKKVFKDYERKGFFRIGALPLLAGEDVRVEILKPAGAAGLFSQSQEWVRSRNHSVPIEWRRMILTVPGEPRPRLEAGRVRLRSAGCWELLEGVTLRHENGETKLRQASLRLTPDGIGVVEIPTSASRFRVFDFSIQKPKGEE
jgi:hypothetical protein